jgi:hypothetical protein
MPALIRAVQEAAASLCFALGYRPSAQSE